MAYEMYLVLGYTKLYLCRHFMLWYKIVWTSVYPTVFLVTFAFPSIVDVDSVVVVVVRLPVYIFMRINDVLFIFLLNTFFHA